MSQANATAKTVREDSYNDSQAVVDAINRIQSVVEFELDGSLICANDIFLSLFDYTASEVQGKNHSQFCVQSEHTSLEYKLFWKALASGEPASGEFERVDSNGSPVWLLASYNPVLDGDGKPTKVVVVATDITAGKLTAIDDSRKVSAIGHSQAAIEFDLDGFITHANDNFLSTLGYTLDEIKGKHHKIFCSPEYVASPSYKQFWDDLNQGKFGSGEYLRLAKNGDSIWINATYNPILDANGVAYKVVKYATNITEQKNIALVDAGKLDAIDRAQAVIEFDLQGHVLFANDNFLQTLGYTAEEVLGKHHRIFCEEDYSKSTEYVQFWENLRSGTFFQDEYKRIKKNGDEVWINASYNPILDDHGNPYRIVKFATDVTQSKMTSVENQGKLAAINKSQAVIEFTPEGKVLTANDGFLGTLGYELDEISGKHHRMFCEDTYTSTEAYRQFWENLRKGEYSAGRFKRMGKGGSVVWIQATYNPILDLNGDVFKVVKFATNVTKEVEIEEGVIAVANTFTDNTREITDKAKTVASGAQKLGATTEEMSASVEELSASIDSIAENSREANNVAKNTQEEADLGSKAIERSIESMELINKSSEEISEIVKVIGEIASQTNLLAFNAAIEAARAGEHGLGFSVVADEVRKLAERSSQATKEITKLINESVKRVVQGGEISKEAATAFSKIVNGVSKTTFSIAEISTAAQEQQTAARDVSNAIQEIADSTEQAAMASESIAQSTNTLLEGAESLKYEVSRFSA